MGERRDVSPVLVVGIGAPDHAGEQVGLGGEPLLPSTALVFLDGAARVPLVERLARKRTMKHAHVEQRSTEGAEVVDAVRLALVARQAVVVHPESGRTGRRGGDKRVREVLRHPHREEHALVTNLVLRERVGVGHEEDLYLLGATLDRRDVGVMLEAPQKARREVLEEGCVVQRDARARDDGGV